MQTQRTISTSHIWVQLLHFRRSYWKLLLILCNRKELLARHIYEYTSFFLQFCFCSSMSACLVVWRNAIDLLRMIFSLNTTDEFLFVCWGKQLMSLSEHKLQICWMAWKRRRKWLNWNWFMTCLRAGVNCCCGIFPEKSNHVEVGIAHLRCQCAAQFSH